MSVSITQFQLDRGLVLVRRCERQLARLLSRGERVDLLADWSDDWALDVCRAVVDRVEKVHNSAPRD